MMDKQTLIKAVREAGTITRCHTVPHHGTYTNAEHTCQAMNLLFLLYPGAPSANLVKALLWHDTAERWTGDMPGPMKYVDRRLSDLVDVIEETCFKAMGISTNITEAEACWLRAVDKIELWLWAHDQTAMGNTNAEEIKCTLWSVFISGRLQLPEECLEFVKEFRWSRLSDTPPVGGE